MRVPVPFSKRSTRIALLLALVLLASGFAAGVGFPLPRQTVSSPAAGAISYGLNDLMIIGGRNLRIGAQLLIGIVSLGAYSVIELFTIGFSLGVLTSSAVGAGMSIKNLTLLIAPHGLIELTAFAVLGALEFDAARIVYRKIRYDEMLIDRAYIKNAAKQAVIGIALILIAALIEVYVTGPIARQLG